MSSGKYDIIIFDEITTARYFNLLSTQEILDVITRKPEGIEIILTGRYAPAEIIAAVDLVTEMVEVKHYYQEGVVA
jgi:cob(I)alamin adenosyltransferase